MAKREDKVKHFKYMYELSTLLLGWQLKSKTVGPSVMSQKGGRKVTSQKREIVKEIRQVFGNLWHPNKRV